MKVYVASSLKNADNVVTVMEKLRGLGVTITYDWTTHGLITDTSLLKEAGEGEKRGVEDADVLFFLHPGRTGAHVELGIALGCKIPVVMVDGPVEEQKTFYYVDGVTRFADVDSAIDYTMELLKNGHDSE